MEEHNSLRFRTECCLLTRFMSAQPSRGWSRFLEQLDANKEASAWERLGGRWRGTKSCMDQAEMEFWAFMSLFPAYFHLYRAAPSLSFPIPHFLFFFPFFKCSLIPSMNWCSLCVRGEKNLSLFLPFFFPSSSPGPVHYFSFLSLSVIGWTEVHRWALKTVSQGLNLVFNAWLQRCHLSSNCSRHPPTLSLIIYWWIKRVGQETGLEKLLIDIKIQCPQPDKHGGLVYLPE